MVDKVVPDLHLKNQNGAYLWITNLKFYINPSRGKPKYIETKVLTTFLKIGRGLELVWKMIFEEKFFSSCIPNRLNFIF